MAFGEARHAREGITTGNVGDGGRGRRLRSSGETGGRFGVDGWGRRKKRRAAQTAARWRVLADR